MTAPITFERDGLRWTLRYRTGTGLNATEHPVTASELAAAIKAMPSPARTLLLIDVVEDSSALGQVRQQLAEVTAQFAAATAEYADGNDARVREVETALAVTREKLEAAERELQQALAAGARRIGELEEAIADVADGFEQQGKHGLAGQLRQFLPAAPQPAAGPEGVAAPVDAPEDDCCYCSDRMSGGLPCLPGKCPNNPHLRAFKNRYCCHACFARSGVLMMGRMIVCPTCGNKRCPKAIDHELACTGSNESGQAGSVFSENAEQARRSQTCAQCYSRLLEIYAIALPHAEGKLFCRKHCARRWHDDQLVDAARSVEEHPNRSSMAVLAREPENKR